MKTIAVIGAGISGLAASHFLSRRHRVHLFEQELRADPRGPSASVFSTETRVVATDAAARARFRWYWSFFSPGMMLIRWMSLWPLKREAERRADEGGAVSGRRAR